MNTRKRVPSVSETAPVNLPQEAIPAAVLAAAKSTEIHAPAPKPEPKLYPAKIAAAIIKITRDIGKITKRGENTFHKYAYAKWEDILDELAPLIATHGLIIIPNEVHHNVMETIATIAITYEFTIINEDGDVWPDKPRQTQLCKIRDNKGVIDDKAASKCFTQAQKYMMLALFKIRTQDMADADAGDDQPVRRKRPVPSSTGKLPPSVIEIVDGEHPSAWAKRFIEAIGKADTETEIDAWDAANDKIITKVQSVNIDIFNQIVDALNANHERVKPKAAKTEEKTALPVIEDDERDWIDGLDGAFSGCEDTDSLDAEHARLMEPQRGKVSQAAWQKAIDLYDSNRDRIEAS